jgi:hypothetical protein
MAVASYEISYLQKLLTDLLTTLPIKSTKSTKPTLLYSDNIGAIQTVTNPDSDKVPRTRHIDICYYIMREALANGTLQLKYIQIEDMTADILTKVLPIKAHRHHIKNMGLGC